MSEKLVSGWVTWDEKTQAGVPIESVGPRRGWEIYGRDGERLGVKHMIIAVNLSTGEVVSQVSDPDNPANALSDWVAGDVVHARYHLPGVTEMRYPKAEQYDRRPLVLIHAFEGIRVTAADEPARKEMK